MPTALQPSTTSPSAQGRRSDFRPDIQGLRTLAVLGVVIYHVSAAALPGGYIGVDVFFVISGFLITGHLMRQMATGSFRFRDFYGRRIRRLLPAALVVLAATLIASYLFLSPLRSLSISRDAAATALYVPNIWFSYTGTDYLSDQNPSPFQQYWSLGVEEQFYLIWPVLLFLAWRIGKRSVRVVAAVLALLMVVSLGLNILVTSTYETWAFFNLPTRAWQFAIGGGVALLVAYTPALRQAVRPFLAWAGLATVVASMVLFSPEISYPGVAAIAPTLGTAVVIYASSSRDRFGPAWLLSTKPAQWIGDRSYSLYLWHWPLLLIPAASVGPLPFWASMLLVAASVLLADLTFRFIENPGRRSQLLRSIPSGRFLIGSAVVVAVIAGTAVGSGMLMERRQISSWQEAMPLSEVEGVKFASFVPSNGTPALQQAAQDLPAASEADCSPGRYSAEVIVCEYGNPDSETTYALFGDSHAAQWFPVAEAIAIRDDARLLVVIKASCVSLDLTPYKDGTVDQFCESWKQDARERIIAENVDRVFLANLHRQVDAAGQFVSSEEWAASTKRTVAALSPVQVTVIGDTPWFDRSPVDCAASNVEDLTPCFVPTDEVSSPDWKSIEAAAASSAGANYVDPTPIYCNDHCGPYIGDTLVFRDGHHLTASFTQARVDEFAALLLPR